MVDTGGQSPLLVADFAPFGELFLKHYLGAQGVEFLLLLGRGRGGEEGGGDLVFAQELVAQGGREGVWNRHLHPI